MVKMISWVEFPVADMDKARAFYGGKLGLKPSWSGPTWTGYTVGPTLFSVALTGTRGEKKGTPTCKGCAPCVFRYSAHGKKTAPGVRPASAAVCFQVEDLDRSYKKLRAKGVRSVAAPRKQGWGGRTALMLDPDQNLIVLTEPE